MKRKFFLFSLFGAFFLFANLQVQAALIGSKDFDIIGGTDEIYSEVRGILRYEVAWDTELFEDLYLYTTTVGDEYFATASTDSDFNDFVGLLTDGINQRIKWGYSAGGVSFFESSLHLGDHGTDPPIDFIGYTVEAIGLQVNAFDYYFVDDGWEGYWQYDSAFTINVYGTAPVPEPATMLLLGTGLVGLVGLGRKRFFKMR